MVRPVGLEHRQAGGLDEVEQQLMQPVVPGTVHREAESAPQSAKEGAQASTSRTGSASAYAERRCAPVRARAGRRRRDRKPRGDERKQKGRRSHICSGAGLTPRHIRTGTGLTPPISAPGLGLRLWGSTQPRVASERLLAGAERDAPSGSEARVGLERAVGRDRHPLIAYVAAVPRKE